MKKEHIDLIDQWCNELETKTNNDSSLRDKIYFWFKVNKKYTKIIRVWDQAEAAHAFVDNKTLDVYKPSTWNAPFKIARYNLLENYDKLLNECEWTGGYLYSRQKKDR